MKQWFAFTVTSEVNREVANRVGLDIAQVAAMFNFTNRLASGLGWQPNPEYFSQGR
mgnify:CR=1 FL=1